MKFRSLPIPAIAGVVALSSFAISSSSRAAQLFKDSSGTDLNSLAAWSTVNGATTPDPVSFTTADELRLNQNTAASGTFTMDLSANLTVGSLVVDSGNATGGLATGNFVINSASGSTLTLNGNATNRGIVLNSTTGGNLTVNANVAPGANNQTWLVNRPLTVAGNVNLGSNFLNITANNFTQISGVISGAGGSLRHNGAGGILYLSNTANSFSGSVTVVGGTLRVEKLANGGSNSSIGSGTGVIALNGAVLEYVGSTTDSTNRTIDLRSNSFIDSNGSGTVSFTAANVTNTGGFSKTLTLRGSNNGNNTLGSVLGNDGVFSASLTKQGAGKWILSGNNTYTGNTTISQGTLQLGNGGSTGSFNGNATIASGATLAFARSDSYTHAGGISGNGSVVIAGAGTTIFTGAKTYTGTTTVSAGTLAVNGSVAGAMTVASGATLQGNGTISGNTTVSGNLKPGNSPGLLTFANSLTLESSSATTMEITGNGTRGVAYDAVDVGSALTYGGTLTLDFSGDLYTEGVYTFDLFNFGSSTGNFSSMSLAGIYSGSFNNNAGIWGLTDGDNSWSFNQGDGILTFTVVPEPNVAMVAGSLALMALLRRRRD